MLDDFDRAGSGNDTGVSSGTGGGTDVLPSSIDRRSEHIQNRAGESANSRSAERSQDGDRPRASGKSIRDTLKAQFELANRDPDRLHADAQAAYDGAGPTVQDAETRRQQDRDERGRYRVSGPSEAPSATEAPAKPTPQDRPRTVGDTIANAITEHTGTPVETMELAGRKFTPNPVRSQLAAIGTPEQVAAYDSLAPLAKAHIDSLWNKRNSDFSKAYKAKHDAFESVKDYAAVFEPHTSTWLKDTGYTGPQVAQQAMGAIWNLAQQDRRAAAAEYVRLGQQFGIDGNLAREYLMSQSGQQPQQQQPATTGGYQAHHTPQTDPATQQRLTALEHQQQRAVREQEQNISNHIDSWKRDKPFYDGPDANRRQAGPIAATMAAYIGNGIVPPLPDGRADLDKAYQMACRAHEKDPRSSGEQARTHRAAHVERGRQAAASVAPRAPTTASPGIPSNRGSREAPRNVPSVRDRLLEAVRQHA
jgi:hypothetical protein